MPSILTRIEQAWRERAIALKALSFGLVGLVNSAVDFGVFSFGFYVLHLPIIAANLIAWIVAVSGSYVMNSQITFAHESGRKLGLKRYFSFALSQVAGFVANTATVYIVSYVLERLSVGENRAVLVGKLLAIGASFAVNFSLSHFVVFRRLPGGGPQT
ncbi:MAG: GtrA family protein [Pseudolabrys sp.]|nr:GtrA family protein [Pseudolabrys sp.]